MLVNILLLKMQDKNATFWNNVMFTQIFWPKNKQQQNNTLFAQNQINELFKTKMMSWINEIERKNSLKWFLDKKVAIDCGKYMKFNDQAYPRLYETTTYH